MIVRIPWKNGLPDLTQEELEMVYTYGLGFSGAEELNHDMPEDRALVYLENYTDEVINFMKQYPDRFEFSE